MAQTFGNTKIRSRFPVPQGWAHAVAAMALLLGTTPAARAQEAEGSDRDRPDAPTEASGDDSEEQDGAGAEAEGTSDASPRQESDSAKQETRTPGTIPTSPVDLGAARYVPGAGLAFESQDGDFALITRLRAQFRYTWQQDPAGDDSQFFQIRRARVQFKGNMWGEHNEFKLELAISPRDMDLRSDAGGTQNVATQTPLLSWYFDFSHLRDLTVRIGQYKVPYSRQRVVSSGDLQFVDRAITNNEFNVDRDLGLDIRSENFLGLDMLRYYLGVYIGEGMNTSDNTIGAGDFGMMYIARIEFLPFGMFEDYSEVDFARTRDLRVSFGAAYAFIDDAPGVRGIKGSRPPNEIDTHNVTADLMLKYGGFSLFSDFYFRDVRGMVAQRDGVGAMVQGAYLLPNLPLEFGARYGGTRGVTSNTALDAPDVIDNEVGVAASYYFAQHPFKLQADYFRRWSDAAGIDDGADRIRVQLQASF